MSSDAYNTRYRSGGTSSNAGQTSSVHLSRTSLSPTDKRVLCKAICVCNRQPDQDRSGAALKQQCVSRNLRDLDKAMDWKSPYKAEVNYDMSQDPPAPIMRSTSPLEPHSYLPAWIQKYWPGGLDRYPSKSGVVRRPDVVIVENPSQPPKRENLRAVVEIKFPPQMTDKEQQAAYGRIAGSPDKAMVLGPGDCDCSRDDADENPIKSAVSDALSELGQSLRTLFSSRAQTLPGLNGLPPPLPPVPVP